MLSPAELDRIQDELRHLTGNNGIGFEELLEAMASMLAAIDPNELNWFRSAAERAIYLANRGKR